MQLNTEWSSTFVCNDLYYTCKEVSWSVKDTSLLGKCKNYSRKKFYSACPLSPSFSLGQSNLDKLSLKLLHSTSPSSSSSSSSSLSKIFHNVSNARNDLAKLNCTCNLQL